MIGIILGVTIPIAYIAIGCAVGIYVHGRTPSRECRSKKHTFTCPVEQFTRAPTLYPHCRGVPCDCHVECGHSGSCDCIAIGAGAGVLWPVAGIFLLVYAVMRGRKLPKASRMGRAQRKAAKVQKRIEEFETELGWRD